MELSISERVTRVNGSAARSGTVNGAPGAAHSAGVNGWQRAMVAGTGPALCDRLQSTTRRALRARAAGQRRPR